MCSSCDNTLLICRCTFYFKKDLLQEGTPGVKYSLLSLIHSYCHMSICVAINQVKFHLEGQTLFQMVLYVIFMNEVVLVLCAKTEEVGQTLTNRSLIKSPI